MTERMEKMFKEPCDGTVTYREITRPWGVRSLLQDCSCGTALGSHLLQDESEIIRPHCERVITYEMAVEGMSEIRLCHRKGVWFDAYMGFWDDGTEMTEEEYTVVRERLELD